MSARAAKLGAQLWDPPHAGWAALHHVLAPASALYGGGVAMRNLAYRMGLFRTRGVDARRERR